jgi:hypothetical protein
MWMVMMPTACLVHHVGNLVHHVHHVGYCSTRVTWQQHFYTIFEVTFGINYDLWRHFSLHGICSVA